MSRTYRRSWRAAKDRDGEGSGPNPHKKERKEYRKQHYRAYRSRVNQAIRAWAEKVVPERWRRTGGWLTW